MTKQAQGPALGSESVCPRCSLRFIRHYEEGFRRLDPIRSNTPIARHSFMVRAADGALKQCMFWVGNPCMPCTALRVSTGFNFRIGSLCFQGVNVCLLKSYRY